MHNVKPMRSVNIITGRSAKPNGLQEEEEGGIRRKLAVRSETC